MQHKSIAEPIKENVFINPPARTTINKNSPTLPTKQKPHVILDKNGMLNMPNVVTKITQSQPHLQPRVIETEMNAVLDATSGDILEHRKLS